MQDKGEGPFLHNLIISSPLQVFNGGSATGVSGVMVVRLVLVALVVVLVLLLLLLVHLVVVEELVMVRMTTASASRSWLVVMAVVS